MFSFHKPKIYRSIAGCCICKAKSSSSRFTDSKKYEPEFDRCFRTPEKRSGEICNACVLLVKRWKKLPPGTQRDWRHVVDARAGPGTKSIKSSVKSSLFGQRCSSIGKKISKPKKSIHDELIGVRGPEQWSTGDEALAECQVLMRGRPLTPDRSDSSDEENMDEDFYLSDQEEYTGRKRERTPVKRVAAPQDLDDAFGAGDQVSSFLDMTFWRRETICCGVIFKGPNNEAVISPKLLKPCSCRKSSSGSTPKTPTGSTSDVSSSFSPSRLEEDNESNASSYASVL